MFTSRRPGGAGKDQQPADQTSKPAGAPATPPTLATTPPAAQPVKPATNTSSPVAATKSSAVRGNDRMTPSILGSDLKLMGNAHSEGEVHVAGEVQGDIQCASLLVEETATITGGVMAEDVIVRGKVMGSVRGKKVSLQSSSHVEGDICHKSLAIEQGAFFEGKSRRAEDPTAGVDRAADLREDAINA